MSWRLWGCETLRSELCEVCGTLRNTAKHRLAVRLFNLILLYLVQGRAIVSSTKQVSLQRSELILVKKLCQTPLHSNWSELKRLRQARSMVHDGTCLSFKGEGSFFLWAARSLQLLAEGGLEIKLRHLLCIGFGYFGLCVSQHQWTRGPEMCALQDHGPPAL